MNYYLREVSCSLILLFSASYLWSMDPAPEDLNESKASLWSMDSVPEYIHELYAKECSKLHQACLMGDVQTVKGLVLTGADACALDMLKNEFPRNPIINYALIQTPLHCAVIGRNIAVINLLLLRYADINSSYHPYGNTPLHVAAWFGYGDIVAHLLDSGARTDINNNAGSMPIHSAVWNDQSECLEILLDHGANDEQMSVKNLAVSLGHTPFSLAAKAGSLKCLRILLAKLRDKDLLQKHLTMKCSSPPGWTPLQLAAQGLHAQCCWDLCSAGTPFLLEDVIEFVDYKPLINFFRQNFPCWNGSNYCNLCTKDLEPNDVVVSLSCGHFYHSTCFENFSIKDWMNRNPSQGKGFVTQNAWFKHLQKHKCVALPNEENEQKCPECLDIIDIERTQLFVVR